MQVEEDPSSQFVDFTNATALEQFVSDAEQTLIAWHLTGKGHAAAEALAAAHGDGPSAATHYTRVLEFEQPPRKPDGSMNAASGATQKVKYALTLFLARSAGAAPAADGDANGKKQWQQGREHFTPTMLAIADATRDMGVWSSSDKPGERSSATAWDAGAGGLSASAIAASAERWFGVDEFLLVTRTSLPSERETKLQQQKQQQALTRRLSRNSLVKDGKPVLDEPVPESTMRRGSGASTGSAFDGTMDTNEANLVLSAIHLALLNCNCTIPAFVPIQYVARGTWLGTAVPGSTGNVSINFETDSTPEANSNQSSISGLLDFFQLKLQLPPHIEDSCRLAGGGDAADLSIGTWVSAAFRYSWRRDEDPREEEMRPMEWRYKDSSEQVDKLASDMKLLSQALFGSSANREHFWGSASNPVSGIELTAVWPNLKEGTYVDNAVHSTLDPESAPQWMMDVQFDTKSGDWLRGLHDNARKPTVPLSRVVANLVHAYANAREISRDVLVSELAPTIAPPPASSGASIPSPPSSSSSDMQTSSSRLPGTIPAARAAAVFGNAIGSITSTIVSAATWKGADIEEIQRIMAEIFDDPENDLAVTGVNMSAIRPTPSAIIHSAPVGELVSVLACRMGQLHGLSAMSLLWVEFVKSLRERWFQQRLLPLLSTRDNTADDKYDESASRTLDALFLLDSASVNLPSPDFRQCLLHQKLQLLNACILRQADGVKSSLDSVDTSSIRRSSTTLQADARMSDLTAFAFDEDDDDEFFDSVEAHDSVSSSRSPVLSSIGVRKPLPGMTSLRTGQPLMEPVTQAAVPLTEDIAKQQQELLSRLGVGPESTVLRQQLQSAALVSDMQAFKAANPGSCLADFIRWYSPKDWIPADPLAASTYASLPPEGKDVWWFEEKGMLSERMRSASGGHAASSLHAWHQMWESSAPVPVSKQKRLFDPVGESEKLYHYLETIAPHEMFHQMLVGAISSCYSMLEHACLPPQLRISIIEDGLQELRKQCDRAVSLLDDAYAESQVAYPTGRDQKGEQEKAKSQLQVAFEMALDACRTMTRTFEQVELMMSQASALLQYFTSDEKGKSKLHPRAVELVASLLSIAHQRVPVDHIASTRRSISELLEDQSLRSQITALVLHNPMSRDPILREYVIRCICPRPFLDDYREDLEPEIDQDVNTGRGKPSHTAVQDESAILDLLEDSPVVVNRMYACFTKETVRFALTLAESEF